MADINRERGAASREVDRLVSRHCGRVLPSRQLKDLRLRDPSFMAVRTQHIAALTSFATPLAGHITGLSDTFLPELARYWSRTGLMEELYILWRTFIKHRRRSLFFSQ